MEEILKEIEQYKFYDLSAKEIDKVVGDPKFGGKVDIKWSGRDELDKGYLFQFPIQDEDIDMWDLIVHVPNPDNSDGMGKALPVWVHFMSLLTNDDILWVNCTGGL